jgi:hypothetical protein
VQAAKTKRLARLREPGLDVAFFWVLAEKPS